MFCLLSGTISGINKLSYLGLAILISIPICRAIYSALWFVKIKNLRGMWFSLAVILALAVSMLLEV